MVYIGWCTEGCIPRVCTQGVYGGVYLRVVYMPPKVYIRRFIPQGGVYASHGGYTRVYLRVYASHGGYTRVYLRVCSLPWVYIQGVPQGV